MTLAEPDRAEHSDIEIRMGSLIGRLQRGKVIPILGPHLYTASADADAPTFDRAIALQLASHFQVSHVPPDSTLREVALRALRAPGADAGRVRARVCQLISAVKHQPEPLRQLAEIRDFQLFVTTGYDRLLQDALENARTAAHTLSYSVDGERGDLNPSTTGAPTVFHLLGTTSDQSDELALTDAELLEHLHCWIAEAHPHRLLTALREHDLLFLGCGFSDWLARFFIRIMSGKRFEPSNLRPRHLVVDDRVSRDPELDLFLSHHNFTVIRDVSPAAFVAGMHRRWTTAAPRPAPPGAAGPSRVDGPEPVVFLSFCNRDREVARAIKAALSRAGVPAFLDEHDIEPGADWDTVISSNLDQSLLFVPLVSRNTEAAGDAYFWSEWKTADKLDGKTPVDATFIVPVALDPIEPKTARVPRRFREVQWYALPDRAPNDVFVGFIVKKYRDEMRRRRSR
jgi:hypothetical protein